MNQPNTADPTGLDGDALLQKIQGMLAEWAKHDGYTVLQCKLQYDMVRAVLPIIYEADWAKHQARILSSYGCSNYTAEEDHVTHTRRMGKTFLQANVLAAIEIADPTKGVLQKLKARPGLLAIVERVVVGRRRH